MVEIGEVFYGELLMAVTNRDTAKVKEMLAGLSEAQLESLWVACTILRRMAKEFWVQK